MKEGLKNFIMLRLGAWVRLFDRFRVKRENWNQNAPIFVLTSGKVASTAVANSLKKSRAAKYVHHIHYLSESGLHKEMQKQLQSPIPYISRNTTLSTYLAEKWAKSPAVRPKIISLVREPVGQLVSVAFQDVKRQSPHLLTNGVVDPEKTIRFLQKWICTEPSPYRIFYEWTTKELDPVAGTDVYGTPFDCSKGYQIYKGTRADLLIIRMENLNDVFAEACRAFFETDQPIELLRKNSSDSKEHGDAYQQVLSEFKLEATFLQKMLSDNLVDHFYSDVSDDIYAKWAQTPSN